MARITKRTQKIVPRILVEIGGRDDIPVLFDTGADISLMRKDVYGLYQGADKRPLMPIATELVSVSGDRIPILGVAELPITIGSLRVNHPFRIMEKMDTPIILGWDFMSEYSVTVAPQKMEVTIKGESFPLLQTSRVPVISTARALHATTIPGRSEVIISAYLAYGPKFPNLKFEGVLEPVNPPGLIVSRIAATAENALIPVRIMNPEMQPLEIAKGTCLGDFHCLDGEQTNRVRRSYELLEEYQSDEAAGKAEAVDCEGVPSIDLSGCKLNNRQKGELRSLLKKYNHVFSKTENDRGLTNLVEHRIDTGDARPIKQPPRRVPFHLRDELETQVQEMLQDGVVEQCSGPWSSPVVLVKKKSGAFRFCVDYRRLNAVTRKDAHGLPRIDDSLASMAGAAFFTNLDLTSGYWQVPVNKDHRDKTAFSIGTTLYRFTRLPFGLCNAPPLFQRLIELAFAGMSWRVLMTYLDDLAIFTKTFEEHVTVLEEVFQRLEKAGLKLQPRKCHICRDEMIFLGHHISRHGIKPDPDNVKKIKDWPVPRNKKQVQSFIGLASYYRRFVEGFSNIARPMIRLTENEVPFIWDSDCQNSFQTLKRCLLKPPILGFPKWGEPFLLHTDASDFAVGCVLSQVQQGQERVIAYYSKALSGSEKNWCTYDKELWAIVWGLRQAHIYLYGSQFTVVTDHKPLLQRNKLKWDADVTQKRTRWMNELSTWGDVQIVYRPGRQNGNADAMSRRPVDGQSETLQHLIGDLFAAPPIDMPYEDVEAGVPCQKKKGKRSMKVRVTSLIPVDKDGKPLNIIPKEQKVDPIISQVFRWVETKDKPGWESVKDKGRDLRTYWRNFEDLAILKETLVRKCLLRKKRKPVYQQVVPPGCRAQVMDEVHGGVTSAHFARRKTERKMKDRFFWPGMIADLMEFCRTCPLCVARNNPNPSMKAPLQTIRTEFPFQLVATDLTELPVTPRGHRYCLVIGDHFTKYVNIYPIKDKMAKTVADLIFRNYVCQHGMPETLHSDQGREYEAEVVQELCVMLGIEKSRTTPYHPQGNGMIERFNETLKNAVAKVSDKFGKDWDLHLGPIQFAYNSSVHETTGMSPYFLLHGREPRLPADVVYGCPTQNYWKSVHDYSKSVLQELQHAFSEVRKTATVNQERQKRVFDKWAKHHPYQVGDRVWLHNPVSKDRHKKLAMPWVGPYVIVKRFQLANGMPGVTYRIQSEDKTVRRRLVVHHNRLKPCEEPRIPRPLSGHNNEVDDETQQLAPPQQRAPLRVVPPGPAMMGPGVIPGFVRQPELPPVPEVVEPPPEPDPVPVEEPPVLPEEEPAPEDDRPDELVEPEEHPHPDDVVPEMPGPDDLPEEPDEAPADDGDHAEVEVPEDALLQELPMENLVQPPAAQEQVNEEEPWVEAAPPERISERSGRRIVPPRDLQNYVQRVTVLPWLVNTESIGRVKRH